MSSLAEHQPGSLPWPRVLGLIAGPLVAIAAYWLLPTTYGLPMVVDGESVVVARELSDAGRAAFAIMLWMAIWWLSEAIDIAATALVPLVAFPLFGAVTFRQAASPYADELIFLFMGGFMIALAMSRWSLDRRIALLGLLVVGTGSRRLILGFMIATAFLSMWVSNTATVAMMLPIAISVIRLATDEDGRAETGPVQSRFALCLLLAVAYAASIGGVATIIGSPPNAIAVQNIRESLDTEISFARWIMIGGPFALAMLPLTWLLLTHVLYPPEIDRVEGGRELIRRELAKLGPMRGGEVVTLAIFVLAATLWIFRPQLAQVTVLGVTPLEGLTDSGVAMLAALLLFVLPASVSPVRMTLDWETARRLPWGVLLLFGGGLSLAAALRETGVSEFIGAQAGALGNMPEIVIVLAVTALIVFLTELTSNTATTATMVPLLIGLSGGIGVDPYLLVIPAAVAASCAFMMPVATPPNAMVFATGQVTIPQMCKAGFWLNLVAIVLITMVGYLVIRPMLS